MNRGSRMWALTAAGFVAIALAAGVSGAVIAHEVWPATQTTTVAAAGGGNGGFSPGGGGGFGGSIQLGPGSGFGGSIQVTPGSGFGGGTSSATGAPPNLSVIAAKVDPAVVDIRSTLGYAGAGGAGTGIVISSDGEVLTNNHVIDGATQIAVTDVGNGRTYTATVAGYDPSHDVAVIRLQGASGLRTATIGDSSKLSVGDAVVGIGNAGGVGGRPSTAGGEITGLNATVTASDDLGGGRETLHGMLRTNAPIQSGDSGGPLADAQGRVVGIDTAGSQSFGLGSGATEAYAIPIDDALQIAKQIDSGKGSSTVHVGPTAFLGVQLSAGGGFGGGFGIGGGAPSGQGLTVSGVVNGQPAQKAGIETGDTITTVAGTSVDSQAAIRDVLILHHPGDRVPVGWTDAAGQPHTATVTLGTGPPQ